MGDLMYEELEDLEFPDDVHVTSTGISNEKLAMWVYLASDCLLFGGMISTYLIYKNRPAEVAGLAGSDKIPSEFFDIPFTSMTSFILLMSSLTMVLSVNAIIRGDLKRMRLWLVATAVLGGLFLGGQAYEFTIFVVNDGLGFTTNVASSAFFALTGSARGPRAGRRDHAVVRGGAVVPPEHARGGGRGRGPLLALRGHRLGPDLHRRVPDPMRSPW